MSLIATKIAKTAVSTAVVLGLAFGTMASLTTTASADGWRRGGNHGYRYAPAPRAYYHEPRRRSAGSQVAKGLAIGIGVAVVGAILADQARRTRNQYYDAPSYDPPYEPGY